MELLKEEYWAQFSDIKSAKKGKKFEKLIKDILEIKYGKNCWKETKNSWDGSKDFFWYNDHENMWAECKNYKTPVGLKVVSNSLVMAEIYNVSTLLFFSYSYINDNTKVKILKYADNENIKVIFYDDIALENLIFQYWDKLGKKYFSAYTKTPSSASHSLKIHTKVYKNPLDYKIDSSDTLENINLYHMFEIDIFLTNNNGVEANCIIEFEKKDKTSLELFDIYPEALQKKAVPVSVEAYMSKVYKIYVTPCIYRPKMKLPKILIKSNGKLIKEELYRFETKTFNCNLLDAQRLIGRKYNKIVRSFSETLMEKRNSFHALCIEGESGTGKSKLLNSCMLEGIKQGKRILKFNSSYNGNETCLDAKNLIKEIIISIYDLVSDDIISIIQKNLKNENMELDSNVKIAFTMILEFLNIQNDSEYRMLIDKYLNILFEKLSGREYLLIIDNVQFFDKNVVYFLRKIVSLGVNCNHRCNLKLLLAINNDYLSENVELVDFLSLLREFNLTESIHGFIDRKECEEFLEELLEFGNIGNANIKNRIIEKAGFNPYFITQYVKWLDDANLLDKKNNLYVIRDSLELSKLIEEMPRTIDELFKKRWEHYLKNHDECKSILILSSIHLLGYLSDEEIRILELDKELLEKLRQFGFICINEKNNVKIISFQHDLVENFFARYYDSFASIAAKKISKNHIIIYRDEFQNAFIAMHSSSRLNLEQLYNFTTCIPGKKMAKEYYQLLFKKIFKYTPNNSNIDLWLDVIINYCSNNRDYLGSEALLAQLDYFKNLEYSFQASIQSPKYGELLFYFSEALDSIGEYEQAYDLILSYKNKIEQSSSLQKKRNFNEILVEAYNRLHVYRRHQCIKPLEDSLTMDLIKESEKLAKEIGYYKFQYVNNSDRGYLYYALPRENEKAYSVFFYWEEACDIFEKNEIPEKQLNFYRKKVQLSLLYGKSPDAIDYCKRGIDYIREGKYAYQKLFFYWWFYLALIESYLQSDATKYFNEIEICFDKINQYEILLNSSKKFYILQLKAIFLYYKKKFSAASSTNKECIMLFNNSKYISKNDHLPTQLGHNQDIIDGIATTNDTSSLIYTKDMLFNLPCL